MGGYGARRGHDAVAEFLDAAITAHVCWRLRLQAAVAGGEVPDRETACNDRLCELGVWMHEHTRGFADLAEFQELATAHRKFHASVGRVIDLVARQNMAAAQHELAHGDFAAYSVEVVASITRLDAAIGRRIPQTRG